MPLDSPARDAGRVLLKPGGTAGAFLWWWGMTARWSDPHGAPGPPACCDPGRPAPSPKPDER